MNPTEFGVAAAAIVTALASLVEGSVPESTESVIADLADDIDDLANGMPDGAAREALQETVAFLRRPRQIPT